MSQIKVKNVIGYAGLYLVDSIGNVISMPKTQGRYFQNKYHILTPKLTNAGYYSVSLSKDGKQKDYLVHRLVASAFLGNSSNLPEVNHINGIKTDNRLENLEWCSKSYNQLHAIHDNISNTKDILLHKLDKINYYRSYCKVILEKGSEKVEFNSIKEAKTFLQTDSDNITRAIRNKGRVKGWLVFGYKRANGES